MILLLVAQYTNEASSSHEERETSAHVCLNTLNLRKYWTHVDGYWRSELGSVRGI
jgi:hypothetical protein